MKNLIALILILFSTNVFAATGSGNVSSVTTLGGVNTSDNLNIPNSNPDGYFSIYTGQSITGGNVGPLYKNGVAYQVTAGKTFVVNKICGAITASNARFQLISATASFANNATTASLTSPVYMGGAAGADVLATQTSGQFYCFSVNYSLAASTFVGFNGDSSTGHNIVVTGKEI